MTLQAFVDGNEPTIGAAWLNQIDVFVNTLFAAATTAALARAALGSSTVGDAVFIAASAAAAQSAIKINRVVTVTDAATFTPNADTTDIAQQANTQALGTLTMGAPTGTPTDSQKLLIRLRSTNVQTFSWNAIYRSGVDVTLPASSTGSSKYDYIGFVYNSAATKWDIVGKAFGY